MSPFNRFDYVEELDTSNDCTYRNHYKQKLTDLLKCPIYYEFSTTILYEPKMAINSY